MKKLKKVLALMMVILMVFSFAACKSENKPVDQESDKTGAVDSTLAADNTQEASTKAEEAAKEPPKMDEAKFEKRNVTVKDITVFTGHEPNEWMTAAAQVYEQQYGGKVTFKSAAWDTRIVKLQQLIQSGDSPDAAEVYAYDAIRLSAANLLEPIEGNINLKVQHYNADLMNSMYGLNGHIYGMVAKSKDPTPRLLIYNKTLFKNAGLETPTQVYQKGQWDWQTFRQACIDISQDTDGDGKNDIWGFNTWEDEIFILANGANMIAYDGTTLKLDMDNPKVKEAIQFYADLYNKDNVVLPEHWNGANRFQEGKLAMYVANTYDMATYKKNGMKDEVDFVPFPQGPSADKLYSYVYPGGWCIPVGAKSLEGGLAYGEIIMTGFPELDEKYKQKFDEEQGKIYADACQNPVATLLTVNGPVAGQWTALTDDIRAKMPLGTVFEKHRPILQKEIDSLLDAANALKK